MDDLISREEALNIMLQNWHDMDGDDAMQLSIDKIRRLPSVEPADKWIPVSERLPEEKIDSITNDYYEYQCTFHIRGIDTVRSYKYGDGHWWHGPGIMDKYVTAWRPIPDPYRAESEVEP